ncbi:hypothetical protein CAEBREN_11623 [Caenorhabditis brenneri]|uniref:RCC1-like domain-containing protein n=1 Tax=Caenorhabditis brenneri TaxID=135651 RepID=G0NHH7_CAEBE|nr:hypothetical protein CAEBREN_11623 [Caenorhabditis brenneri]
MSGTPKGPEKNFELPKTPGKKRAATGSHYDQAAGSSAPFTSLSSLPVVARGYRIHHNASAILEENGIGSIGGLPFSAGSAIGLSGERQQRRSTTENTTSETPKPPVPKKAKLTHPTLSIDMFIPKQMGDRVLSCGEGAALGHPLGTTTKKPRKIDIFEKEGLNPIQVVAGKNHSAVLTSDGQVFMCGINEKGSVPVGGVKHEGSNDEFTKIPFSEEIKSEGKIVMLAAGASFTIALTNKGSVFGWGDISSVNPSADLDILIARMQENPTIIIHQAKRRVVKIAAGEKHLALLDENGAILTLGDGQLGQLGRKNVYRSNTLGEESGEHLIVRRCPVARNVFVDGYWTIVHAENGQYYGFGMNDYAQLGTEINESDARRVEQNIGELHSFKPRALLHPTRAEAFEGDHFVNVTGIQHVVALNSVGEVFAMGKNINNALGLNNWDRKTGESHWLYDKLQAVEFDSKVVGVSAKLATSIAWTEDGTAYAWGLDTTGQLGLGLTDEDDKMVGKPAKISSAHHEGYSIIGASISDCHTLFLAKKN